MTTLDITSFGASSTNPDNTSIIQGVLDQAGTGNDVYIPNATFLVDAQIGLRIKPNTRLQIDGTLKAIPKAESVVNILRVQDVSNVDISFGPNGGLLGCGDLFNMGTWEAQQVNTQPDWGMGINVLTSDGVRINGGKFENMWRDGILLWLDPKNVTITNATFNNSHRQGISIISGGNVEITNNVFTNTTGDPGAGIDIEPSAVPGDYVHDVTISRNRFTNNTGGGVQFGGRGIEGGVNVSGVTRVNVTADNIFDDKPIVGNGTGKWYAHFLYQILHWLPFYNWWGYPRSIVVP